MVLLPDPGVPVYVFEMGRDASVKKWGEERGNDKSREAKQCTKGEGDKKERSDNGQKHPHEYISDA